MALYDVLGSALPGLFGCATAWLGCNVEVAFPLICLQRILQQNHLAGIGTKLTRPDRPPALMVQALLVRAWPEAAFPEERAAFLADVFFAVDFVALRAEAVVVAAFLADLDDFCDEPVRSSMLRCSIDIKSM